MPRKAKEKKASSYRPTNFSSKNTSLLRFGYCSMLADGKLSKENIIDLSSKTFLGQLKNDKYIEESSSGMYQTTAKFKREFSKMIGSETNFGGSTSGESHQKLVSDICSKIPENSLIRGEFKNGNQLSTENGSYKKTPEYKGKLNDLKQSVYAAQRENKENYINDLNRTGLSKEDKIRIEDNYLTNKKDLELKEKTLNDNKRGVSAPDFQFSLTKSNANEFIESIRELEEKEEYSKYKEQWEETLSQMQDYISSCETQVIEICTEILDSNYTRTQILSKEFYSVIYEKPVFFFRT